MERHPKPLLQWEWEQKNRLNLKKKTKTQRLAISTFAGAVVSADGLCKTLSAKKPKKFTVCYSVPNKDGKQAFLAERLFQPKYTISLHLCISQRHRTATLSAANSKITFKGRIQYFAAKGSHMRSKFSPNLELCSLTSGLLQPQEKSVTAHFNLQNVSPAHDTAVSQITPVRHPQQNPLCCRTGLATTKSSGLVSPSLSGSGLRRSFATGCHRMSQLRFRRKAQGQRRVPSSASARFPTLLQTTDLSCVISTLTLRFPSTTGELQQI